MTGAGKRADAGQDEAGEGEAAEAGATRDGEPEEKPGRLARIGAGWKVISGAVATIATAVGVLATLGLVGGGEGAAGPEEALASGVEKTVNASSSRVRVSVTESPRSGAAPSTFVGEGEFDYRTGRGRMVYDFSRQAGTEGRPPVEVVFNGPTLYFHDPGWLGFPKGTPWARATFADLELAGQAEGAFADLSEQIEDPTQAAKRLVEGSSGMREVGEEAVVGVDWTHYRAQRDPDAGGPAQPATEDAWVDEAGYLRKIETTSPGRASIVKTRTEYDDFGVDVGVRPPPSGRVVDLIDLLG